MIHLVIFDLAGTTVSDGGVVEECFVEALQGVGLEGTALESGLDTVRETMGRSKIEVFEMVLGNEQDAFRANRMFESAYHDALRSGRITPIEGAEEVFGRIIGAGMQMAFTTGFGPATRTLLLDSLGWSALAVAALSPDQELRGRPHPDMILAAASIAEIDDMDEVAVVGDNPDDLESGRRAGASMLVGVLSGASDERRLRTAPCTHILDSVADLPDLVIV